RLQDMSPPRSQMQMRGQVLVLFALMLPVLIGAAGLMVDLTSIERAHTHLQAIAAAAARAGAQEISTEMVALADTFSLSLTGAAAAAAEQVCSAYGSDAAEGLTCSIDVTPELTETWRWSPAR